MGSETAIQWTDHTANPWIGCTKVSDGCKFCYAEKDDRRKLYDDELHWGPGAKRLTTKTVWTDIPKWNRQARKEGRRHRVFCASLCDIFDSEGPAATRHKLWDVIEENDSLDWQLLTKRPENITAMVPGAWIINPPRHVWYGTSVEDNRVRNRINILADVPAAIRFVSIEPMLGPINYPKSFSSIQWAIYGGESGDLLARELNPQWVRDGITTCAALGVAVFVKQMGSKWAQRNGAKSKKGGDPAEWPADLRVRNFPRTSYASIFAQAAAEIKKETKRTK